MSLKYGSGTKFKETGAKECPKTWTPTKKPTIEGKKLMWGGTRPYKMKKVQRFGKFKLGKFRGYHIEFHFFSMDAKKKRSWGMTKEVSLILDNPEGVIALKEKLKLQKVPMTMEEL